MADSASYVRLTNLWNLKKSGENPPVVPTLIKDGRDGRFCQLCQTDKSVKFKKERWKSTCCPNTYKGWWRWSYVSYPNPGSGWSASPTWYSLLNLLPLPSFIKVGTTGGFLSIFCKFFWCTMLLPIPEVYKSDTPWSILTILSSNHFQAAADHWGLPDIAGRICHLYCPL